MVWGDLPLVAELIWLVHDALCAAKEPGAVLLYQLSTFWQLAMGLFFWRVLCQFHACDALVAVRLAGMLSFAAAPASEPTIHYATVLRVARCN